MCNRASQRRVLYHLIRVDQLSSDHNKPDCNSHQQLYPEKTIRHLTNDTQPVMHSPELNNRANKSIIIFRLLRYNLNNPMFPMLLFVFPLPLRILILTQVRQVLHFPVYPDEPLSHQQQNVNELKEHRGVDEVHQVEDAVDCQVGQGIGERLQNHFQHKLAHHVHELAVGEILRVLIGRPAILLLKNRIIEKEWSLRATHQLEFFVDLEHLLDRLDGQFLIGYRENHHHSTQTGAQIQFVPQRHTSYVHCELQFVHDKTDVAHCAND